LRRKQRKEESFNNKERMNLDKAEKESDKLKRRPDSGSLRLIDKQDLFRLKENQESDKQRQRED
jgi:hypothetical protein